MKRLFSIFLLALSLGIPFLTPYAQDFVSGFEDIPLMKGFKQIDASDIAFGNEETRFIEAQAVAVTKISFDEVKDFYVKTLAHLGWTLETNNDSALKFYRENDALEISKSANSPLKISISLKNRH